MIRKKKKYMENNNKAEQSSIQAKEWGLPCIYAPLFILLMRSSKTAGGDTTTIGGGLPPLFPFFKKIKKHFFNELFFLSIFNSKKPKSLKIKK
jgi:hypothetical protein